MGWAMLRTNGRDAMKVSAAAMRAALVLDACDSMQEVGDRFDHRGRRWWHVERGTSGGQSRALARGGEQAVVSDALESPKAGRGA